MWTPRQSSRAELQRKQHFLTGLPISSLISPTPAGSSLLGLLWYRSASFTWTSCSSKASFWRSSFCVWPAWTPRSFSRARITLSLPFISSIWKEIIHEGSFCNIPKRSLHANTQIYKNKVLLLSELHQHGNWGWQKENISPLQSFSLSLKNVLPSLDQEFPWSSLNKQNQMQT